jgi:hypothetical protein
MKKILTLICCTMLIAATSCTKKYITPGTTNRTIFYTVKGGLAPAGDWAPFTDSGTGSKAYQTTLGSTDSPLPELDSYTQANGAVLVYISYDKGATYEAVPETYSGTAFSFIHSKNSISIYAQSADGGTAVLPTSDILVKIVLVDSNPQ